MEQVLSLAMLALAIALLAVLMRMHSRLADIGFDPDGDTSHSVHQVAIPVRVAMSVITLAILLRAAERAQADLFSLGMGLVLVPMLAWLNAYVWQFKATLSGTDLTVMTPGFRERTHDLTRLIGLEDDLIVTWHLRFQGGEGCWLLKYLSGRNTLRRALTEAQPHY
ncbi:hypothetical protein [Pseudooceanicola sp.]|uniref:hypothetical protein n=1 Tax=Pseudooceanicola sp. TaxID=1914328 RepID=UPI0035C70E7D